MTEEWRPIAGFEGWYEVSDQGRVRSVDRVLIIQRGKQKGWKRRQQGKVLLQSTVRGNYRHVGLCATQQGTRIQSCRVHALVAAAFIGPRPTGMHVCHNDGNPENNCVGNLRYDTPKENVQDSIRMGRRVPKLKSHCKYGHAFDQQNTGYIASGNRYCKKCASAAGKKYYSNNREKVRQRTNLRRGTSGEINLALDPKQHPAAVMQRNKTHCPRNHEYTPENTRTYNGRRHCRVCDRMRGSRGTRRSLRGMA